MSLEFEAPVAEMAAEATGGDNLAERVSALETYLLGDGENLFQKCVGEHRRMW